MNWARILAYVTGTVDQELLARNEYLAAENRILKAQLDGRLKLSDAERTTLGEIGRSLGRKVLAEIATVARPDTILAWHRKFVARKFDGSQARRGPGRPRVKREVEQLTVRMAGENRDWGLTSGLCWHWWCAQGVSHLGGGKAEQRADGHRDRERDQRVVER
jgi:putative transposase